MISQNALDALIQQFIKDDRKNIQDDLNNYTNLESAANGIDCNNRKHDHQRRIGPQVLADFAKGVSQQISKLHNVQSFEDIYDIINGCRINGIGKLAIYDTAVRIGNFRGIVPTKVYLQQGAKWGATALGVKGDIVPKDIFDSLGFEKLTAHEIECFLCLYHKKLG